jgi:hypothetical protein
MASYGDVIYNPTAAYAAAWLAGNTFGTPVPIDYIGTLSFEYESDTDQVKSGGMIVETITIPTKVAGEMNQGSLDYLTWGVMTGFAANEYSTTPNRYYITTPKLGGEGLPYFGLIVAYAAVGGANLLVGFPKAKLDNVPGFTVDQNKFRIGSANWTAVAASTITRMAGLYKKYETASAIPTTAAAFLQFFTNPINLFA